MGPRVDLGSLGCFPPLSSSIQDRQVSSASSRMTGGQLSTQQCSCIGPGSHFKVNINNRQTPTSLPGLGSVPPRIISGGCLPLGCSHDNRGIYSYLCPVGIRYGNQSPTSHSLNGTSTRGKLIPLLRSDTDIVL